MGNLHSHNLKQYIDDYNLSFFIETGTGTGNGLAYAALHDLEKCFSIEVMPELFFYCAEQFKENNKCYLVRDNSINGLTDIFEHEELSGNVLFWLDAHFPGADYNLASYTDEKYKEIRLPLIDELCLIFKHRPDNHDVFIIDDLRIYEDGPYESGNIDKEKFNIIVSSITSIHNIFKDTHHLIKDYRQEGFLIAIPK